MRPILGFFCFGLALALMAAGPKPAFALPGKALTAQDLAPVSVVTEVGKKQRYKRRAYRRSYKRRYGRRYGPRYYGPYAFGPRRPYTYDYYYYPQYRWPYHQPGFSLYLPY